MKTQIILILASVFILFNLIFVSAPTIGWCYNFATTGHGQFGNATFMGYNWIDRGSSACIPLPCKTLCSNTSGGLFGNFSGC